MKKIYLASITCVLAIAVVIAGSRPRAHAGSTVSAGIPLSQLAGSFAGQSAGNYGVCFDKTLTTVQSCKGTPSAQVIPWLSNETLQDSLDTNGNSCGEDIDTNAPLFPGPFQAQTSHLIDVGVISSYNPTTASGIDTLTFYLAQPGVSCNGATFVNTAKAPVLITATIHFVVSEQGNRLDFTVLTYNTTSPVNSIAGDVLHGFLLRQTSPTM